MAALLAIALFAGAGCRVSRTMEGEGTGGSSKVAQYPVETAPASRLRPAVISVGLGGTGSVETSEAGSAQESRVTNGFVASFSADGKLLAVIGGRTDDPRPGLWVAEADGARPRRLLSEAVGVQFSPVGTILAVTFQRSDGALAVGTLSASGGTVAILAGQSVGPAWSPDGGRIAYLVAADIEAQTVDLAVSGIGGSAKTPGPAGMRRILARGAAPVVPVWGPDARTIYYVDGKTGQLWSVEVPQTGGATKITPKRLTTLAGRVQDLSIGRDGRAVAFLEVAQEGKQDQEGVSEPARGHVRLYSTQGAAISSPLGERVLTHPRLSADGARLWAATDGGALVVDTQTGSLGFVPVARRRAYLPTPSPDGRRLVVVSPSSDVAASLLDIQLGVYAADQTTLIVTDLLPATTDPEKSLEALWALEPASLDTTQPRFAPGYPDSFESSVFPELPANKTAVAAGRYDLASDAAAMVARLNAAGLRPQVFTVR